MKSLYKLNHFLQVSQGSILGPVLFIFNYFTLQLKTLIHSKKNLNEDINKIIYVSD